MRETFQNDILFSFEHIISLSVQHLIYDMSLISSADINKGFRSASRVKFGHVGVGAPTSLTYVFCHIIFAKVSVLQTFKCQFSSLTSRSYGRHDMTQSFFTHDETILKYN